MKLNMIKVMVWKTRFPWNEFIFSFIPRFANYVCQMQNNLHSASFSLILMTQHLDGQDIDPQDVDEIAFALPMLLLLPLMTIKLLKGYDFLREESFYLFSARDYSAQLRRLYQKRKKKKSYLHNLKKGGRKEGCCKLCPQITSRSLNALTLTHDCNQQILSFVIF